MRNIFSGSFSQVEDAVSESFAKNSIDTIERFSFGKAFLALLFGLGVFYAIYGFGIFMGNNMDSGTIMLDVNNEYIPFLSNIWFAILPGIFILMTIFGGGYYRKKNNVKAFFIYNTFLTMYLLLFLLWTFKVAQLVVRFFPLRMVYTVLFILCITSIFIRSYKSAKEMVFGEKKKRSAIVEGFSRNRKSVLSVLAGIGALYFLAKTIIPSAGDMETRMMGALIDFAPFIVCLVFLSFLYLNSVVIRSYYLHKYSEEFRIKFGVDKSEWYGKKHKDNGQPNVKNHEM